MPLSRALASILTLLFVVLVYLLVLHLTPDIPARPCWRGQRDAVEVEAIRASELDSPLPEQFIALYRAAPLRLDLGEFIYFGGLPVTHLSCSPDRSPTFRCFCAVSSF